MTDGSRAHAVAGTATMNSGGSSPGNLDDRELAMRAQQGSMPCFVELVSRHEGPLLNFAARRIGRTTDAHDIVQDTFLRAWKSIDRYQPRYAFSTWLYTIASRLATDHVRKRRRESGPEHDWSQTSDPSHVEHAARQSDQSHGTDLWALAQRLLGPEQHAALWLRYAEDLSISQIARVLGRTPISVRVMLFRARSTLARHAGAGLDADTTRPTDSPRSTCSISARDSASIRLEMTA